MPSQVTRYRSNEPITYEALSAILPAGKLVAPQNAPATSDASLQGISVNTVDAAQNILGYTTKDAVPISLQLTYMNGTMGYDAGYPFADASTPTPQVAVAHSGVTLMAYTGAACAYGDRLAANATGGVASGLPPTSPRPSWAGAHSPAASAHPVRRWLGLTSDT
jgi:hypothetical protein